MFARSYHLCKASIHIVQGTEIQLNKNGRVVRCAKVLYEINYIRKRMNLKQFQIVTFFVICRTPCEYYMYKHVLYAEKWTVSVCVVCASSYSINVILGSILFVFSKELYSATSNMLERVDLNGRVCRFVCLENYRAIVRSPFLVNQ